MGDGCSRTGRRGLDEPAPFLLTDQVLGAVEARLSAPRAAGAQATLAGQALPSWDGGGKTAADPGSQSGAGGDANASDRALGARDRDAMTAIRDWMAHAGTDRSGSRASDPWAEGPEDRERSRALTGRDFVTGTSFALTGGSAEGGRVRGAVGPGRDHPLRRTRGRSHARRRGDDRADGRGLGVGPRIAALDGGAGGGPCPGHGRLSRGRRLRGGELRGRGRGDADRRVALCRADADRPALGLGRRRATARAR